MGCCLGCDVVWDWLLFGVGCCSGWVVVWVVMLFGIGCCSGWVVVWVAMLFEISCSSTVPLSDSITLGPHKIPFSDSARNLGFILDSKLSMKRHIIKVCQTANFKLKRISSIRRFLTEDATKTCSFLYPFTA